MNSPGRLSVRDRVIQAWSRGNFGATLKRILANIEVANQFLTFLLTLFTYKVEMRAFLQDLKVTFEDIELSLVGMSSRHVVEEATPALHDTLLQNLLQMETGS